MELLVSERWADIVGYEGRYRISSAGNVLSVGHSIVDSAGRMRVFPDKIITPCYGRNPRHAYAHINLNKPDAFMGYKYPSHLSRDLHVRGGKCKDGYFAYREDGKRN